MSKQTGLIQLLKAVGLIALGWLAILPWIAERPQIKSHLDWLDDRKINPSAMYYTELEAMDEILQRQQRNIISFSRDPVGKRAR